MQFNQKVWVDNIFTGGNFKEPPDTHNWNFKGKKKYKFQPKNKKVSSAE
jgi:hypothetical protein